MKKAILLISLALCATAFAGCHVTVTPLEDSSEAVSSEAATETPAVAATEEAAASTGKIIEPLPASLDISALEDCTFAASFPASAVATDADGAPSITMTVYDYERFDLVDISQLAPGDTIVVEGKSIAVATVERNDSLVTINGGIEQGGCHLTTDESGVYFPTIWDGFPEYHALGEVTLPIDQSFVYTDSTDLNKPEVQYNAEEFMSEMAASNVEFAPQGTTVCVENGQITELTQKFTP